MQAFRDIDNWVFDLDNTLYPIRHNLFAQIDVKMTSFIQTMLAVDKAEAYRLQKLYLRDYGTTLAGLMREHAMEPHAFLAFVHDIDVSVLPPDPALRDAIAALPGRKFIFTNGTADHAARVATRLNLHDLFEGVFDIVAANYVPKPNADIYPHMLTQFNLDPQRTAFFEDMARNLAPAHALGMTTILVHDENDAAESKMGIAMQENRTPPAYVHHCTPNLKNFLHAIATLPVG